MKRALPIYALTIYAFLHLPLLILAVFSFNASKFTLLARLFPPLVSSRLRRSRPH